MFHTTKADKKRIRVCIYKRVRDESEGENDGFLRSKQCSFACVCYVVEEWTAWIKEIVKEKRECLCPNVLQSTGTL